MKKDSLRTLLCLSIILLIVDGFHSTLSNVHRQQVHFPEISEKGIEMRYLQGNTNFQTGNQLNFGTLSNEVIQEMAKVESNTQAKPVPATQQQPSNAAPQVIQANIQNQPQQPQQPQQQVPIDQNALQTSNQNVVIQPPVQQPKKIITDVEKPILGKGFKQDYGVSYQRIKINELSKKFLFLDLKLLEKDKWQEVNLTATIQGTQTVVADCKFDDSDSCFIPNFVLRKDMVIFITIKCQDDCTYNLNSRWSDIEHLYPGQEQIFMFGEEKNQIFHVELDQQEKIQEVRVHLTPRVTRRPFDNVKMYGKYGSQKPPTELDYDFRSVNLWQDGQGIFLQASKMKSRTFTLLIVGQAETTYRLLLQKVTQSIHQIENNEHIYQYLSSSSEKKYSIKNLNTAVFNEFSIKFSILSGQATVKYFIDPEMTKQYPVQPLQYMQDSQFFISADQIGQVAKSGIFVRVTTSTRDAMYTIKFVARTKDTAIQLNQHIYSFIPLAKEPRLVYFNFKRWVQEKSTEQTLKFTFYAIQVLGKVTPQFRICNSMRDICTSPLLFENSTSKINTNKVDSISEKQVYELQISDKLLSKINAVEQQSFIIVKLQNDKPSSLSMIALEFINNNKILHLREGRPIEQKLAAEELRIYKYVNSDPDVSEIRIHVNKISGDVAIKGLIKKQDARASINIEPSANTLRFTEDLLHPILMSITARTKAIFGISMQIIHKKDTTDNSNIYTIGQDLTYTVKIQPLTYAIFEVIPIYYEFKFQYSSSQSVIACLIDPKINKCINLNSTELTAPQLSTKGTILQSKNQERKKLVKITNPFADSVAQVAVIFHSRIVQRCLQKKLGKVYSEVVSTNTCFEVLLDQGNKNTLNIYISKRQLANLMYTIFLCGNSMTGSFNKKFIEIPMNIVQSMCGTHFQSTKIMILWNVNTTSAYKTETSVKADFVVQYEGGVILLPEGVSYNVVDIAKSGFYKKFSYNVINKQDLRIILNPIRGMFNIYAKIISQTHNNKDEITNINYHFSSTVSVDYSQRPMIIITEKQIKQANCADCIILIAVYNVQQSQMEGKTVEFELEVVQRASWISDNGVVEGYLQANSNAYYTYTARQQYNTTLLFLISDHNQHCANMYLGYAEYPSSEYNLASSQGRDLVFWKHAAGQKKYFLTVQATKLCDFTISVISSESSISKLERGKQNPLKLVKGSIKYFAFDNYNEPFRIITMAKYGEVKFYLNRSKVETTKKTFTTNQLDINNFEYVSDYSNTISIDQKHHVFCQDCNYFLAVQAIKNTQSTIFLASPTTVISLAQSKYFNDYLPKKNDYSLLSYKKISKTNLKITVYKGELQIKAVYHDYSFSQTFTAKSEFQNMIIDVASNPPKKTIPEADVNLGLVVNKTTKYVERTPINFIILAKSDDTRYTLQAKSLQSLDSLANAAVYQQIIAGQPNHVTISSEDAICLTGYFRDFNEDIVISTNSHDQQKLAYLVIQGKVGNEIAKVENKTLRNTLTLVMISQKKIYQGINYQICVKLSLPQQNGDQRQNLKSVQNQVVNETDEVTLNAIVTQSNVVNILASDAEAIVKGQNTYIVHSDGQFLLDVLECKGVAKISYGKSLTNFSSSSPKNLQVTGMSGQQHAIRISQKETTTYVNIKSEQSIVKWLPINYETDEGTGYIKFTVGDIKYNSKFKNIEISYQPLQNSKTSKSTIKEIQYMLILSNNTEDLDRASQCDSFEKGKVFMLSLSILQKPKKSAEKIYLTHQIQKSLIEEYFSNSQNIYMTIVAILTLEISKKIEKNVRYHSPSSDEHEHYRFIYNRQQISLESYRQSQIESIPYHYLILLVLSVAGLFLLIVFVFTRKIVPLIARLKNSNLVEEAEAGPQGTENNGDLVVPPSSDRNQRVVEAIMEPQGMK